MIYQNDLNLDYDFTKYAIKRYNAKRDYLNRLGYSYNQSWDNRQSYLYNTFRIDYLNQICINQGLVPIFLTLTLPSAYHPKSSNYQGFNIYDGYTHLQDIFRNLYNGFRYNRKRVHTKFIRVIEPHKSYIPHLHAIVYVPSYAVDSFVTYFHYICKKYLLRQTDIKILDVEKYAVVYLLKYVEKSVSGGDVRIAGWRLKNKIRMLTMSPLGCGIDYQVFKRLRSVIKYDKSSEDNYFTQILSKCYIEREIIDLDGVLTVKSYGDKSSMYHVYQTFQKLTVCTNQDYIEDEDIECLLDDNIYYKLIGLDIYRYDEMIYSKVLGISQNVKQIE